MFDASEDGRMLYSYGVEGLSYGKDADGNISFTDLITNNETYTSAFSALRSIRAWPTYFIDDSGEAFMKIFEGTKVETACKDAYGNMKDPFRKCLVLQKSQKCIRAYGQICLLIWMRCLLHL